MFEGIVTGAENTFEAELVAQLTKFYRRNLFDKKNKIYLQNQSGDNLFWKNGLFIVSPHHKQILRIKKELKKVGLRPPYFVDTVDKMQGQETDIVIISYGLSDQEQAINESEFIYSLNRLNVSITRGRAKTILFISKELLNPTLEILQKKETAEGITFMLQLEKYIYSEGEKKRFVINKSNQIFLDIFRMGF